MRARSSRGRPSRPVTYIHTYKHILCSRVQRGGSLGMVGGLRQRAWESVAVVAQRHGMSLATGSNIGSERVREGASVGAVRTQGGTAGGGFWRYQTREESAQTWSGETLLSLAAKPSLVWSCARARARAGLRAGWNVFVCCRSLPSRRSRGVCTRASRPANSV